MLYYDHFSCRDNQFVDNGDGTISDLATGLMWQTSDDGVARDWEDSLSYAEKLTLSDYDDWRLPNAKELQSIVDYSRSPETTDSPAIDPLFYTTEIRDPDGDKGQYPYFWTGTTIPSSSALKAMFVTCITTFDASGQSMNNLAYSGSFFRKILTIILFLFGSFMAWSQGSDSGLTATIIGSGAPGYDEDRGGASVLISQGDTLILVDMGNGTQGTLNELGVKVSDISTLLFTHHHVDHNEEYIPILISSMLGRHEFQIFGPPGTSGLTESILTLYESDLAYRLGKSGRSLGNRSDAYTVQEISGGESFAVDGINISTVEVPHTIHTIAYRFDYEDQSIVISGDLTYTEALSLLAGDADILIMDSGGMVMKGSSGGT